MIIGLSGYARSGKDTVAELLCLNYQFNRLAFADEIKNALIAINPNVGGIATLQDMVEYEGWEQVKIIPHAREMLQNFGVYARENWGKTFWIDKVFDKITDDKNVVISDVRFPNEADAIKARGGVIWRINRHNFKPVNDHSSEHAMDTYMVDHVIYNDSTLDELADEVFMSAKKYHLS